MTKMIAERIRCISDEIYTILLKYPNGFTFKKGHITERKERVEIVKEIQGSWKGMSNKMSQWTKSGEFCHLFFIYFCITLEV